LLLLFAAAAAVMGAEPVLEEYEGLELKWCSVNFLRELTSLTRLTINVQEYECNEIFWRCMSNITNLRDLHVRELDMSYFGGIVELASCQELTCLLTDCTENFPDFEMKVRLLHTATIPRGFTTTHNHYDHR
jgi:hypothetical protein